MSSKIRVIIAVSLFYIGLYMIGVNYGQKYEDPKTKASSAEPGLSIDQREFTLEDGTRCVAIRYHSLSHWTGVSCDWQ